MSKVDTNVSTLKINRGTFAKIVENIESMGDNELIILEDKAVPVPSANDNGKVIKVNASGEYELGTDSGMTNPMTNAGDLIIGGSSGTPTRLAKGTAGKVLTMNSGATAPEWATPTDGTVTSVAMVVPAGLSVVGSPITSSGTLNVTLASGYAIPQVDANGCIITPLSYLTTAPSANNPNGLILVVLDSEPATYYSGYYYIITEP